MRGGSCRHFDLMGRARPAFVSPLKRPLQSSGEAGVHLLQSLSGPRELFVAGLRYCGLAVLVWRATERSTVACGHRRPRRHGVDARGSGHPTPAGAELARSGRRWYDERSLVTPWCARLVDRWCAYAPAPGTARRGLTTPPGRSHFGSLMRMHDRERRLWTAHVRELEARKNEKPARKRRPKKPGSTPAELEAALEDLVKASPTALVKAPKV